MIVDVHTHVFPPQVIARREELMLREPTFAELYADPKARLATADDLLTSMAAASIDAAVCLGFAWQDAALCREYNDYLLEVAAASEGRLLAFCTLPLAAAPEAIEAEARRCLSAGGRGFGELRPESQGCDLAGEKGDLLARLALEADCVLLFHVTEPVGHAYAGKAGLDLRAFADFVARWPAVKTIGAHWGGGLPFYALMPEVDRALASTYFDTAASSLLYAPAVYQRGAALAGAGRVLFGSDFPLLEQSKSRGLIEASDLEAAAKALILGQNAARLLKLE